MSDEKREFRRTISYIIGEDLSEEEYTRWKAEIALWLSENRKNETDVRGKAEQIMSAAVNGTKLNGKPWINVQDYTLDNRIRQFCGYDILTGKGPKRLQEKKPYVEKQITETKNSKKINDQTIEDINLAELLERREKEKAVVLKEFKFLESPVYETNLNAYCDTVAKLGVISDRMMGAEGKQLMDLMEIRSNLKSDISDFMKLLKIHPSQVKDKVDEGDRGDVGSLIKKWDSYTELGELYEKVDAIQEALQIINQLETIRIDGSPQLADWLLWHKTACRSHDFTCPKCEETYKIHGGFTPEEMYAIVEQSQETFGYGAKRNLNDQSPETDKETEEGEADSGG